jgi:aryl-alcohol dehydrogenase-like predicted oxidoreductase
VPIEEPVGALCEGLREPAYEIRWLLDRSPVMLSIPGTSTVAHLEKNMQAVAD